MEKYLEILRKHIAENPPNFGDADSVLTMLYECYSENNPDNEQIKADFDDLYQQMNGMPLREMDNIIYPVCKLCRDHECSGFIEGIRIGILLVQEVKGEDLERHGSQQIPDLATEADKECRSYKGPSCAVRAALEHSTT